MDFVATRKTPPRDCDLAGHFEHGGRHFGYTHRRYAAYLSSTLSRYQLDFLRLGGSTLFHADHHFRVRALFRHPCGVRSRERTGAVGFCDGGRGTGDRGDVTGAGGDCGCERPPQAVGRGVRRTAGDRLRSDVVRPGDAGVIPPLLLAYGVATVGVEFATVFNNAMMPTLVPPHRTGRLSGTGWATGYIGGILSLILVLGFLAASPETGRTLFGLAPLFGLDPVSHQGDRITGPLTGIWFVIFVLPMFLFTPDYPARRPIREALREGLSGLKRTLGELPKQKSLATFLLANMIYTDGLVSLFAFGGIYAAGTFGWHTIQIGSFGILLAVAGTFGAWLGGKLDDKLGPKRVIAGSLLILLFALSAILLVEKDSILFVNVAPPVPGGPLFSGAAERAYLVLGCLIGAAGGPLQAASRTLLIRLAPQNRIAQYFGLFALTGKVTSVVGPLLIGAITAITGSQKAGMALLVVFFVAGLALLTRVRETS